MMELELLTAREMADKAASKVDGSVKTGHAPESLCHLSVYGKLLSTISL